MSLSRNLSLPERFAWAVPHDADMWRLVPVPLAALGEGETMIDRWQTKGFCIGRYVWWEVLDDVAMHGREGWKTAILAVVNDRGIDLRDPANMHCRCLLGHFVVYKRHYRDDDECGLEEDLYVPMSREEVVVAIDTYKKRVRERERETRYVEEAIETQQTLARLGK